MVAMDSGANAGASSSSHSRAANSGAGTGSGSGQGRERMRPGAGGRSGEQGSGSRAANSAATRDAKSSRMTPDSLRRGGSEGGASSADTKAARSQTEGASAAAGGAGVGAASRERERASSGSRSGSGESGAQASAARRSLGGHLTGSDRTDAQGNAKPKKTHHVRNTAAAAAAVPVASGVAQVLTFLMLLKWIKGILMGIAAGVMNMIGAMIGFVVGVAKSAWAGAMAVGAAVSNAVGGAISTMTAAVSTAAAAAATVGVAATMAVGSVVGGGSTAMRDDGSLTAVDCQAAADAVLADADANGGGDSSAKTEANAKMVYSIFAGWGMPKENVAGILGNWDAESRVDPTSVEGIFDEPFRIGEKKKAAEAAGFGGFGSVSQRGIGFGQWTNERNVALTKFAKDKGGRWEDPKMQIAFMISAAEGSNAEVIKSMIKDSKGSPGAAAVHFHDQWERSADSSMELRRSNAEKWMGKMGGWSADKELADSLLKQADASLDTADAQSVAKTRQDCRAAESNLTISKGGLNMEQATKLMQLYRKEGNSFLTGRYGAGGPGSCGADKADNCVSFSTYFVNKYTSYQKYSPGNGVDLAASMASGMGKKTSHTPKPYSVASGAAGGGPGHTFVVLGIEGENAIIGEASYCSHHELTHAKKMSMKELTSGAWEFTDVSDLMLPEDKIHTS